MKTKKQPPIHPGEILAKEFLGPRGISPYRLAKDIRVPPRRIDEIVHGLRAVSADTALRLGRDFSVPEQFWINLQSQHDLAVAEDRLGPRLAEEVRVYSVNRGKIEQSLSFQNNKDLIDHTTDLSQNLPQPG